MSCRIVATPILVLLVLLLVPTAARRADGGEELSVRELLMNPGAFDGQLVSLSGRASMVRLNPGVPPSYAFALDDGTQIVTVVAPGAPACQPSRTVVVRGWFRGGRGGGFDRVEAISVRCQ